MARKFSLVGLYEEIVTYKAHAALTKLHEGKAVTLVADGTVGLGTNGAPLEGKLVKLELDGFCSVMVGGFIELPYSGTAPALDVKVVVDGAGAIKAYAIDTITNAMLGRGFVKSVDTVNTKATIHK